jgi:hypothetical protein
MIMMRDGEGVNTGWSSMSRMIVPLGESEAGVETETGTGTMAWTGERTAGGRGKVRGSGDIKGLDHRTERSVEAGREVRRTDDDVDRFFCARPFELRSL